MFVFAQGVCIMQISYAEEDAWVTRACARLTVSMSPCFDDLHKELLKTMWGIEKIQVTEEIKVFLLSL